MSAGILTALPYPHQVPALPEGGPADAGMCGQILARWLATSFSFHSQSRKRGQRARAVVLQMRKVRAATMFEAAFRRLR
jgi:hypothetical protein